MIEISTPEVAIWPRVLDFGSGVGTEKRKKVQVFPVNAGPEGIIQFPEGTKWVGEHLISTPESLHD
jgi:hypothetical protein